MSIYEKLVNIQNKLKAPKSQYNSFSKFKYRSLENILEAVKPHLLENNAILIITDAVKQVGERYYVEATALLVDADDPAGVISVTASAREEETKKGMDGSQITGTASSYARKYACNGLFAIDDTKDADTDEFKKSTETKEEKAEREYTEKEDEHKAKKISKKDAAILRETLKPNQIDWVLGTCKVDALEDMTNEQFGMVMAAINKKGQKDGAKSQAE